MKTIARLTIAAILAPEQWRRPSDDDDVDEDEDEDDAVVSAAEEQYAKRIAAANRFGAKPLVLVIDLDAAGELSIRAVSDAAVGAGAVVDIAPDRGKPGVPMAITVEQP